MGGRRWGLRRATEAIPCSGLHCFEFFGLSLPSSPFPPALEVCQLAGGCPAATPFSLSRQRKGSKRKATLLSASPFAGAYGGNLRCSVQPGPGSNSLRSDNRPSSSVWPSAPRRSQKGGGVGSGFEFAIGLRRGRALRVLAAPYPPWIFRPPPVGPGRGAQPTVDQGERLFEPKASSSSTPLRRAPQVARSEAEGPGPSGRLSFGYFSLATQRKVPRPPGRDPACRQATATRNNPATRCTALAPKLAP